MGVFFHCEISSEIINGEKIIDPKQIDGELRNFKGELKRVFFQN